MLSLPYTKKPFSVLPWWFGGYIHTTLKLTCWQWLFDSMQRFCIILPIVPVLHLWDQPLACKVRTMMAWPQTTLNRVQFCQCCGPRVGKLRQQEATAEQTEMIGSMIRNSVYFPAIRPDARARVSRWSWWRKEPGSCLCHTGWSHYQGMISHPFLHCMTFGKVISSPLLHHLLNNESILR